MFTLLEGSACRTKHQRHPSNYLTSSQGGEVAHIRRFTSRGSEQRGRLWTVHEREMNMAESEDERWHVDSVRDTSMQTRLIPLSDLEDEGLDVADESVQPTQPLPPSFFPTNTGRMRPIIVAAQPTSATISSTGTAATSSSATRATNARTDTRVAARVSSNASPQTTPFVSLSARIGRRTASAPVNDETAAGTSNDAVPSESSANAARESRTPRISYSLQYRALHPRD